MQVICNGTTLSAVGFLVGFHPTACPVNHDALYGSQQLMFISWPIDQSGQKVVYESSTVAVLCVVMRRQERAGVALLSLSYRCNMNE